jgi:rSAM/selenodomain-associated transferase 1
MNNIVLAQYAKWPQLGQVKTRIGRVLGDDIALEIHQQLLTDILLRFSSVAEIDYQLWLSSLDYELSNPIQEKVHRLIESRSIDCKEQLGVDLGQRMTDTLKSLARHYEQVAIIGSDCPNVTLDDLYSVSEFLSSYDVVIIPAEDGGYVLISMTKQAIEKVDESWLDSVAWGTSKALNQTLACCERSGLRVCLLPESWDVDEVEDYQRWKEQDRT